MKQKIFLKNHKFCLKLDLNENFVYKWQKTRDLDGPGYRNQSRLIPWTFFYKIKSTEVGDIECIKSNSGFSVGHFGKK